MNAPIRLFFSLHVLDAGFADGLKKQLNAVFTGRKLEIHDRNSPYPGLDNALGGEAWLRWADVCVVFLSSDYLGVENSWEWEMAKRLERERRPSLQVLVVYCRTTNIPTDFQAFAIAPGANDPIQQPEIDRDRQLYRVAHRVFQMVQQGPARDPSAWSDDDFPASVDFLREKLLAESSRANLLPQLALLKKIADEASLKKAVYEMEDLFAETLRQGKLAKISLAEFLQRNDTVRTDFQYIATHLKEEQLIRKWRAALMQSTHSSPEPVALFIPTDEISIPETVNMPIQQEADEVAALTHQQTADFRRELLLAQDALSVENYVGAFRHCEQVRTRIDPQSAQLYEYLLLTFLLLETADRIAWDAVDDERRRLLNHIVLYANRLHEYLDLGKCPTLTGTYNLKATAEELSNALCRIYDRLPNDYTLDTGKRADEMPDNRAIVARCREAGEIIFRSVHPYTGFMETLVLELCGGGKYDWVERVEVMGNDFIFVSKSNFEIETNAAELINLLSTATRDRASVEQRLSDELYIRLTAKRKRLHRFLEAEHKAQRQFNDPRSSVIRFVQSCLLGHTLFHHTKDKGQRFLRMALEYLMPNLVVQPAPEAATKVRWFTLNDYGDVMPHPDCASYRFDGLAIVEKIIQDHSGSAAWLQVQPNLKRQTYLQYVADIKEEWQAIREGLQWNDFRRMPELEARLRLIAVMRQQAIAFLAYPDEGQAYLNDGIQELIGSGLLQWLYLDPHELKSLPDNQKLGFDALAALKWRTDRSVSDTEMSLREQITGNIFLKSILPQYQKIKKGHEEQRRQTIMLLLQALAAYRYHAKLSYLDFVFQELTEEQKFKWINIGEDGHAKPMLEENPDAVFNPIQVLNELAKQDFSRFRPYSARERIAEHRMHDLLERYWLEISEFRHENRRPEREHAIDIIRKIRGVFLYFPKESYLDLPIRELSDKGRIRWRANFLGWIPTKENHYENKFYHFNYRWELHQFKQLLAQHYIYTEKVLRDTGEL